MSSTRSPPLGLDFIAVPVHSKDSLFFSDSSRCGRLLEDGLGKGYRLEANYTEDAVALAIELFLNIASFPFFSYSVETFSRKKERWLGADARLNSEIAGFKPFYLQFKRPSAYSSESSSKITQDRRKKNLAISPSLFFHLRKKQKNHKELQHNILFKLRRRVLRIGSDAVYVCPLFLDREAYRINIRTAASREWLHCWHRHPIAFDDVMIDRNSDGSQIRFPRIPVFNEHISIPPHVEVDNANHAYSFNENGTEILFHSPEEVQESSLFGDLLKRLSKGVLERKNLIKPEQSLTKLKEMISKDDPLPHPKDLFESEDDGMKAWAIYGEYLKTEFDISQFVINVYR